MDSKGALKGKADESYCLYYFKREKSIEDPIILMLSLSRAAVL